METPGQTSNLVIDPEGQVRAFDPCLWVDPTGRLWLFWAQAYYFWDGRGGVWAITTGDADLENPVWSSPRRLADGVMMNKPTSLADGTWLLPAAAWNIPVRGGDPEYEFDMGELTGSNVIASSDQGKTWDFAGQARIPGVACDEHIIIERADGSLWMLARTEYGIGESVSLDQGKTWSPGQPSQLHTHTQGTLLYPPPSSPEASSSSTITPLMGKPALT